MGRFKRESSTLTIVSSSRRRFRLGKWESSKLICFVTESTAILKIYSDSLNFTVRYFFFHYFNQHLNIEVRWRNEFCRFDPNTLSKAGRTTKIVQQVSRVVSRCKEKVSVFKTTMVVVQLRSSLQTVSNRISVNVVLINSRGTINLTSSFWSPDYLPVSLSFNLRIPAIDRIRSFSPTVESVSSA